MIFQKETMSFHLIMLGVLIYPLYFTSFGMNYIDRNLIESLYFILGLFILLLNIKKNHRVYYMLVVFSFIMFFEYIFNPLLIYNYAPDSMVAFGYGIVGNYGLLFYFLFSNIFFFTKKFNNAIGDININFYIKVLSSYFIIYSSFTLFTFYNNYGTLFISNGVNGHAYHLAGISLWIYLLMRLKNEPFTIYLKLLFLYNFLLLFFIFKTRGILFLDLFLLMFAFEKIRIYFVKLVSRIPIYKVFIILSFFIVFIMLFLTNTLTQDIMMDSDIPILAKNGAGERDVTILHWITYLKSVYFNIGPVLIPEITPHSTYVSILGSIGVLYTIYFLSILLIVFIQMFNRYFFIEFSILLSSLGIYFAVAVVSPLNFFYYIFILIIFYRYGIVLTKRNYFKCRKGLN